MTVVAQPVLALFGSCLRTGSHSEPAGKEKIVDLKDRAGKFAGEDIVRIHDAADLNVLEICAGAGGQSSGLEQAGFAHTAVVEIDPDACATLRLNRPEWNVIEGDVRNIDGRHYRGIDLLAGGVPCQPFSMAGKQLGAADDRDLFQEAMRLVREAHPSVVMLENVRNLQTAKFADYRRGVLEELIRLGYTPDWQVLNASDYGVPQLRPRFILVAVRNARATHFRWPTATISPPTVGETLKDLMGRNGWPGVNRWAGRANGIGPTVVGGSRKHGGPDLGPTRARAAWLELGVDGRGIANEAPTGDDPVDLIPKLTLRMAARIQGFEDSWQFHGLKTAAYRQIGNAFPPPVARAVGQSIRAALGMSMKARRESESVSSS